MTNSLLIYEESGYLFNDATKRLEWFEIDKILISFTYGVVRYIGTWGGGRTDKMLEGERFYSSEECFKKGDSIPKRKISIYDAFRSLYGFFPIDDYVWEYKNGRAVSVKLESFDVEINHKGELLRGCCHDEIARHCPELARFILLYYCNHYGAPMYPVENGTYHIKNSNKSVAIKYLRISDKEYLKLSEAVDDKMYFKYLLFNLGIVDRWKRESDELIAELEDLCGKKWVNPYKPEEERFTLTLTDEERLLIEERIKAGYYSAENIEKRREEAHKAKMLKKRTEICERYDKVIREAETDKKIMLCVFDYGLSVDNVIYYNHTNTLVFNWCNYIEKITKEKFDDFVNNVDRSRLPEGIKFELEYF